MRSLSCFIALLLMMAILAGCATRRSTSLPSVPAGRAAGGSGQFQASSMRIVVSVRHYYASERRSYHHLILYRGDGVPVRQLTSLEGAGDFAPEFSPDGTQVCFQRKRVKKELKVREGYYLIDDLNRPSPERYVGSAPSWYRPARGAEAQQGPPDGGKGHKENEPYEERFSSPEGRYEIIVRHNFREDKGKGDPHGGATGEVTFWLRDRQSATTERLAGLPGFEALSNAWLVAGSPFFYDGPLKLVFFYCHIGSTDGESFYALDLNHKSFLKLAPNGGRVVPVKGVPGFFFICEERYQDLGYDNKKVECEYLDFWNTELKHTHYAPPISAYGGAAVYLPGRGATAIP